MHSSRSFRNKAYEFKVFKYRIWFMVLMVLLLLTLLMVRMGYLQVVEHEKYQNLSEDNRIQLQPIAPNRGVIYDRNGIILAENLPSYRLTVVRERTHDLQATLDFIAQLIGLSEYELKLFNKKLKYARRPYQAITLKRNLTPDEIAKVMVNRFYLPGVDVAAELVRHYPQGEEFAHVLGYVGRINQKEQERLDKKPELKQNYSASRYIGKLGVEKHYETILHGKVGYQTIETNARGRIIKVLNERKPIPGEDIYLHLDSRLQLLAKQVMQSMRGALVAIDIQSGGILSLYSNPSFDPNLFVNGISHKKYSKLRLDKDLPLFNRATRGRYPPASTLKPYIGLAVLDSNTIGWKETINDKGYYQLPNEERLYRDWKRRGHGIVDMEKAIVQSCDTYFYNAAVKTGMDKLVKLLGQFGFGRNLALDIPDALSGILPTREWKKRRYGHFWFPGDTVNLGIGQGFMLATPLQMATAVSILANKGKIVAPRLIFPQTQESPFVHAPKTDHIALKNPYNWVRMQGAMQKVISSKKGTAHSLSQNMPIPIAGKTGTAQVVGIKQDAKYDSEALLERQRDHALFVAFAPVKNPSIAIAVVIENGESAGSTAGPIAKRIINEYLYNIDDATLHQ